MIGSIVLVTKISRADELMRNARHRPEKTIRPQLVNHSRALTTSRRCSGEVGSLSASAYFTLTNVNSNVVVIQATSFCEDVEIYATRVKLSAIRRWALNVTPSHAVASMRPEYTPEELPTTPIPANPHCYPVSPWPLRPRRSRRLSLRS
jgi:hypothetical protein